jgi:hypothetical protein
MDQERLRAVGLGMAGSGGLLAVFSMLVANGIWLLVTGTVFVLIGIVLMAGAGRLAQKIDQP